MIKRLPIFLLAFAVLSILPISRAGATPDEGRGAERVLHHPKAEVEKAIQDLHATLSGRLPALDGFALDSDQSWDHLTRGYFECSVQAVADGADDTRVHATAKITAWYTDSNASQSGYRVLLSNGRVEEDLLDRIEGVLAAKGAAPGGAPQSSQSIASASETSIQSSITLPPARLRPETGISAGVDVPGLVRRERSSIPPNIPGSPAVAAIGAPNHADDIESLRRKREETEKRLSELTGVVQNLDEILHNQSHPTDLVVVRKSGTRVMSKPASSSSMLFSADSEDEFQLLDGGPDWVHVQISGASRGWIRRSDLYLPEGLSASMTRPSSPAPPDEPIFRVVREETNAFKGNWDQLNGKTVKIIWTGSPALQGNTPSAIARKKFARSMLISSYQDISSHNQSVAGVVIVFDSADGGQIATTLENLKQWQSGALPEATFWRLCSIDPAELFSP